MSLNVDLISRIDNNVALRGQKVNFRDSKIETLTSDVVEIKGKNKKELSKTAKWGVALGSIALATILGLLTHRHIQINKAIKAIDLRFDKLKENLPEVQKTFREVFMRRDLSEKEALELLEGYRIIEKRGVKLSKKKYAQEVFDFAKRNYGIHNQEMPIVFAPEGMAYGACTRSNSMIKLTPFGLTRSKEDIFSTIHHELRHAKQHELMYHKNSSSIDYDVAQEVLDRHFPNVEDKWAYCSALRKRLGNVSQFDKSFLDEVDKDFHFRELIKKNFGESMPEKVPPEAEVLVDKILKFMHSTVHYPNRPEEIDAFAVGEKMTNLLIK